MAQHPIAEGSLFTSARCRQSAMLQVEYEIRPKNQEIPTRRRENSRIVLDGVRQYG
jgi:hypothetical protein